MFRIGRAVRQLLTHFKSKTSIKNNHSLNLNFNSNNQHFSHTRPSSGLHDGMKKGSLKKRVFHVPPIHIFDKWLQSAFLSKFLLYKNECGQQPHPPPSSAVTIVVVHMVSSEEVAEPVSGARIKKNIVPFGSSHWLDFSKLGVTFRPWQSHYMVLHTCVQDVRVWVTNETNKRGRHNRRPFLLQVFGWDDPLVIIQQWHAIILRIVEKYEQFLGSLLSQQSVNAIPFFFHFSVFNSVVESQATHIFCQLKWVYDEVSLTIQ